AVLEKDPVPLQKQRPDVPTVLAQAVRKCCARSPSDRYANVALLARDLAPLASPRWRHLADAIEQTLVRAGGPSRGIASSLGAHLISVSGRGASDPDAARLGEGGLATTQGLPDAPRRRIVPPKVALAVGAVGALAILGLVTLGGSRGT